jgi:hypothetical protein
MFNEQTGGQQLYHDMIADMHTIRIGIKTLQCDLVFKFIIDLFKKDVAIRADKTKICKTHYGYFHLMMWLFYHMYYKCCTATNQDQVNPFDYCDQAFENRIFRDLKKIESNELFIRCLKFFQSHQSKVAFRKISSISDLCAKPYKELFEMKN